MSDTSVKTNSVVQSNIPDSILIDTFKTARKLLKKPVDYTNLDEVHSRCKIIMQKLGSTLEAFENVESSRVVKTMQDNVSKTDTNERTVQSTKPRSKRKHLLRSDPISGKFEDSKLNKPPLSSLVRKKRRTFKPFDFSKTPVSHSNIVAQSQEIIDSIMKTDSENVQDTLTQQNICSEQNTQSCTELAKAFSPMTASNTWELLQLRRKLEDPFLPSSRKQYLHNRILELNESIINDMLKQAESSELSEFYVLEKLFMMLNDDAILPEQKQHIECVLIALREKVISNVMKDASDTDADYDKTIDKLQNLLRLQHIPKEDKEKMLTRVLELRGKMASGLAKQTHVPLEDGLKILEKIRSIMNDPFLPHDSKSKLINKVKYLRNQTVSKLTSPQMDSDNELISKLHSVLQDPHLPYVKRLAIVEKVKKVEGRAVQELKNCRKKLKDQLQTSMNDVLGFDGTNLEFITGYGVHTPEYVRCIYIWNPSNFSNGSS